MTTRRKPAVVTPPPPVVVDTSHECRSNLRRMRDVCSDHGVDLVEEFLDLVARIESGDSALDTLKLVSSFTSNYDYSTLDDLMAVYEELGDDFQETFDLFSELQVN